MLSLKDFKKIRLEDKSIFDTHYQHHPPMHSGELFTTMISWAEYVEYHYAKIHDSIIILSKDSNGTVLHAPSGTFDQDLFTQVMKLAIKEDCIFGFIKKTEKDYLSNHYPTLKIIEDRDYFDYVYRASDLAELPGTKYGKIRNRLNKFTKNFSYTTEEITQNNMDEVNEFLKRWCLWKDCSSDELLENERKAIIYSMKHYFDFNLKGLALRIDGTIQAIAVYEKMNPDTMVVHFEKGSPDYDGIYKAINMETAQRVRNLVPFIDREEDVGIPGLRQAKLSYHPDHFIEVFYTEKESLRTTIV
ncbi:MAG TPA: phosphatidylglycerol lysyltransferase domain-containing protein [Candidatus Thermoplasmatota archaeon]|nr:phosphatidylglycerol lysyltransferase domain-containing protein [Candidatus Thermoplasmatota archaeon]